MQSVDVVATMADGRKVRQVSETKFEVTTYKGKPATDAEIGEQIERLRKNYTQMGPEFFATLIGELTNDKWPAARIADAVSHVLRTKPGGFLSIADIFSFDRPFKLYNYSGYLWLINSGRAQDAKTREQSDFATIDIDGKTFFYLKKDLPQNKTK
jgi:hypothetical protein